MSRYGKDEAYQFAIATGLDYTESARAPLLKAPTGGGWELIFVQFVTDWYTVWRRPRDGYAAKQENQELAASGYEPPPTPVPAIVVPRDTPLEDNVFVDEVLHDKGLHGPGAVERTCVECGAPVNNATGIWACTNCGRAVTVSDLMG